jgi:hypothetical protein
MSGKVNRRRSELLSITVWLAQRFWMQAAGTPQLCEKCSAILPPER